MVRRLKYLVLSRLRSGVSVTQAVIKAIADHYNLVKKLRANGKLEVHYPLLGRHGGVSIYVVESLKNFRVCSLRILCSILTITRFFPFWSTRLLRS